jgi:hypothetical protein
MTRDARACRGHHVFPMSRRKKSWMAWISRPSTILMRSPALDYFDEIACADLAFKARLRNHCQYRMSSSIFRSVLLQCKIELRKIDIQRYD